MDMKKTTPHTEDGVARVASVAASTRSSSSTLTVPQRTATRGSATVPATFAAAPAATTTTTTLDPGPPPDGGTRAWLQVLAGHLVVFNAWGSINSFGIFQGTYASYLDQPESTVSWIGSLQLFLVLFVGAFAGRALDAGLYRWVLWGGAALQVAGVLATSFAHQDAYWQVLLAQGLCQGLGFGLIFCPTIALVATYFSRRRTVALQCAACGGATGGIVFPLIAQNLLPRVGFAWTLRAMGLVVLVNSLVIVALMRPRLPPRTVGPLIELAAFRELPYLLYTIGSFFAMWGTFAGYYYARVYALDVLGVDEQTSFSVLLALNAAGLPGRLVPGLLADRYSPRSPVFVAAPCIFCAAVTALLWSTATTMPRYWAWIAIYGFFGASIQGLFPATIPSLSNDPAKNGTRIGMCFSIVSIASLTGPPLAGRLLQVPGREAGPTGSGDTDYLAVSMWAGVSLLLGSAIDAAAGATLLGYGRRGGRPARKRSAV